MIFKEIEIILTAIIGAALWVFFKMGIDKLKVLKGLDRRRSITDWWEQQALKKKFPHWCDYCFSFWASITALAIIQPPLYLWFSAPIIAVIVYFVTNKYYGQE
jgi:hypothetical protein